MKLSEHFDSKEFRCSCGCGKEDISPKLIVLAEDIRSIWNKPINVHSGCRCKENQKELKLRGLTNTLNSQHCECIAFDFNILGVKNKELHKKMKELYNNGKIKGLGLYDWGCHVDIRKGSQSFWDYRSDEMKSDEIEDEIEGDK